MYNALLTVTIAGATYCRDIVLAFIPHAEPFIELHAHDKPTLSLRVEHVRNRISHKQQGYMFPKYPMDFMGPPWFPGEIFPMVSIRAFILGTTPGLTIPPDGASEDKLKELDVALEPWGLKRVVQTVKPQPKSAVARPPKDSPFDLRVVFKRAGLLQWYNSDGTPVTSANVFEGKAIGGLHVIGPDDTNDDRWLLQGKSEGNGRPCFAHVPKDAVTIPSTRSVEVEFLDDLQVRWIQGPDWPPPASIPKNTKLRFKAVLANPLNPDQVAFVLQDNRYAHLPSSCFKYIDLPAGDLTDLPKFQKPQPATRTETKIIGWMEVKEAQTCHVQLADDGVSRSFAAGEFVMVRQWTTAPDGEELVLLDGHTWRLKRGTVERRDLAMWIQIAKPITIRIFRPKQEDLLIPVPRGARLLVDDIAWTDAERGDSSSPTRRFICSGKDKFAFELQPGEYTIGQTPVRNSCAWINGPVATPIGTSNVVCEVQCNSTVEVVSPTIPMRKLELAPMKFFATLVELRGETYIVTLPDGRSFEINKHRLHIVGGASDARPPGINAAINSAIAK